MDSISDATPGLPVMLAYGIVILLYLLILRLLVDYLRQIGAKHHRQRSAIDARLHRTRSHHVDGSMQAFDAYSVAVELLRGGLTAIGMAVAIVLMVIKTGLAATTVVTIIVVIIAWAINRWLRARQKTGAIKDIRRVVRRSGSVGSVILLSVILVILLYVMVTLH